MKIQQAKVNCTKQAGITMVELMVVVVIIALLAAVAIPGYQDSVRKAHRTDAQAALMGFASAMERHYTATGSYLNATTGGDPTSGPPAVFSTKSPTDGTGEYYQLTVGTASATGYVLEAAPVGGQLGDIKCQVLTLDHTGAKGITDHPSLNASDLESADYCW